MRNKSRLFERPEEKAYELGDDEEEDDLQGEERQAVIKRIVPKHDAIGVDLGGRVTGQVRRRKRLHGMAAPSNKRWSITLFTKKWSVTGSIYWIRTLK